jgi:hypothetical protein
VYSDKSALEQMHCALLLQVMRQHGLGQLLDHKPGFKKLLLWTVLATDMSVHQEFMRRFKDVVVLRGEEEEEEERKVLMCQAMIKCADISNPVAFLFLLSRSLF